MSVAELRSCRQDGHFWPNKRPSDLLPGESDTCRHCGTTATRQADGKLVYSYGSALVASDQLASPVVVHLVAAVRGTRVKLWCGGTADREHYAQAGRTTSDLDAATCTACTDAYKAWESG